MSGRKTYKINEKYHNLMLSILESIEKEYARLYFNKYQKEPDSPFRNTGAEYRNDTFAVKAYDWSGNYTPNFRYRKTDEDGNVRDINITWYKNVGRGMTSSINFEADAEDLNDMLNDCMKALKDDFEPENSDALNSKYNYFLVFDNGMDEYRFACTKDRELLTNVEEVKMLAKWCYENPKLFTRYAELERKLKGE